MRIELTTDRAEMTSHHREGDVIDVPLAEAQRLIKSGQAVPAAPAPVETATVAPPRNAALRHNRR